MRGQDDSLDGALIKDWRTAPVSEKTRAALAYAVKLTTTPKQMTEEDVKALRRAGYTDTEIVGVVLVTTHFNFMNRLAMGLGIEPPRSGA